MGAVTFSLDPDLLSVLVNHVSFSTFVETGTFHGDSVTVVQGWVPNIISVESEALMAAEASARFANDPTVRIVCASGADALSDLRPSLAGQDVLYLLDAHWCAMPGGDVPVDSQCELLAELAAIGSLSANSVVLIDDARLFLSAPPAPHDPAQWPTLQAVLNALIKASSTHEVAVVNDVIVFFPPVLAEAISGFATRNGVDWLTVAEKARGYDVLLADNVAKEQVIRDLTGEATAVEPRSLWAELSTLSETTTDSARRSSRFPALPSLPRTREVIAAPRAAAYRARGAAHSVFTRPFSLAQYAPRPPGLNLLGNAAPAMRPAGLPGIAIAMPSFNQARYIESSIRSVVSQSYPSLQFVIQDGGSLDGSVPVIETFSKHLHGAASKPDNGQANAINLALDRTDAEIMGWLNSDDLLLPGALAAIGDFFARHPDVDVVYASRLVIDDAGLEIGRWVVPPNTHEYLNWADYIPQETLYWRRSLWERVGGQLDTSLAFALDWDLLLRFTDAGATFACLPQIIGAFRVHGQSKTLGSIQTVGAAEMNETRRKRHGRHVTAHEINTALTPLYVRAWQSRLVFGR